MWANRLSSEQVNGTITIASFSNDKSLHPCTLNSVPINTIILLVPFNEGLSYGCSSYSDVIESATVTSQLLSTTYHRSTSEYYSMVTHGPSTTDFPTDSRPTPTMARNSGTITTMDISFETNPPDHRNLKLNQRAIMNHINSRDTTNDSSTGIEVLIFTSMNDGDPGIKEKYTGSLQILSKTAPALTLMKIEDMANVQDLLNQTSYAIVTQENSRNTSRSSSNGGGNGGETSTRNERRKRNTIEILFGRKSFVGL
ncbi:9035_t:CDS:2 [Racocetra fulgida]|uniref:9035_t:CDS:1 n=1 Tax=Racocetra fulgida TaxID=60492 RepID=A0A9N8Z1B2_9GLOM|nr:9035_t:CDS:2 [Racocetra fulgida]